MRGFILLFLFWSSCGSGQPKDLELIKSSVDVFYKWYFEYINTGAYFEDVKIVKDGEYCKLENEEYFSKLKALAVLDNHFISQEVERMKPCVNYLEKLSWDLFFNEENSSDLGEYCDFLDYYFWIMSQEKFDGYEINDPSISGSSATAMVKFYVGNKVEYSKNTALVYLIKKDGQWIIDDIKVVVFD